MAETKAQTFAARPQGITGAGIATPFILPYAGIIPNFAAPPSADHRAAVLGRATIGRNAKLGASSVIRADGHFVRVGDDFFLADRGTVHIAHDVYPTTIGDRATVGTNAVVHACTVGSDVVVGVNAVILDGSVVSDNVVIEAGSIVFPRSELAGGKLYAGMPARPVRDLRDGEAEEVAAHLRFSAKAGSKFPSTTHDGSIHDSAFIAATARLDGRINAEENTSVWFGCELDANGGEIAIGRNTNIQDNSWIHCRPGHRFAIGPDSTIGHNVTLGDCAIGARSLIGIGAVVANGTIVEDDVFLAAGGETTEGQVLESGYLWGRRPAVKMAPLDQAKRDLIKLTIEHYCGYARAFAAAQRG
jgi:carbonic anhydrase/acetyltransferase-like protein (isoleucine patch superfamily)